MQAAVIALALTTLSVALAAACAPTGGYTRQEAKEAFEASLGDEPINLEEISFNSSPGEGMVRAYRKDRDQANQEYNGKLILVIGASAGRSDGTDVTAPYYDLQVGGGIIRCYMRYDHVDYEPHPSYYGPTWLPALEGVVTEEQNRNRWVVEVLGCRDSEIVWEYRSRIRW